MTNLKKIAEDGSDHRFWYQDAHALVKSTAKANGWNVTRFCDVLALTSPRVNVIRNWKLAVQYMTDGSTNGMMPNVIAALRHYESCGEIRGPKTSAFARNLAGDWSKVVLDVWVARALGIEQSELGKRKVYDKHAERIKRLARRLGWMPCEVQAAIWASTCRVNNNAVRNYSDSTQA